MKQKLKEWSIVVACVLAVQAALLFRFNWGAYPGFTGAIVSTRLSCGPMIQAGKFGPFGDTAITFYPDTGKTIVPWAVIMDDEGVVWFQRGH